MERPNDNMTLNTNRFEDKALCVSNSSKLGQADSSRIWQEGGFDDPAREFSGMWHQNQFLLPVKYYVIPLVKWIL